jgi:glutamyl-tRNA synthetase
VKVRDRYAPSPTGALHPGNARSALFNYLFAHREEGTFILRIEDTDRRRHDDGSLATIMEGLRWLGLEWDEGPERGGPHEPYFQSERLPLYQAAADRLVATGDAYRCFCTPERLEELRRSQERAHMPPGYDGRCRDLDPAVVAGRVAAGDRAVIRMRVPGGSTAVVDLVRGTSEFANATLDDQVLVKSDGYPTYHLASVVDDHEMDITHVVRGDEWLPSAPKHVLLYGMLGWEPPVFVHLPLVLGPDRAKLSKRHGAVALLEYRDLGYLPEAMVNFLALLGWSPGTGDDFMTLPQLVQAFDIEKVQVSPAVFDAAKLDHLNGQHIRALPPEEFAARVRPWVPELREELLAAAAPLVQERMTRLTEAPGLLGFLVAAPDGGRDGIVPKKHDRAATIEVLRDARAVFAGADPGPGLEPGLRDVATRHDWKFGEVMMTLRIALTGSPVTPPLLESAALLGQEEVLGRIDASVAALEGAAGGKEAS